MEGEKKRGGGITREKITCSRNLGSKNSAILCNCCTRHTRLPGRESARRVEAGRCKDSKSKHSHIKGGLLLHLLLLHTVMTTAKYLVKRVERSVLTRESFCALCSETPSY